MKNRLQKRKRERYPPQRVGNTNHPTHLFFLLLISSIRPLPLVVYILTPPRFHKRRGIEMMGVLYSFSLLSPRITRREKSRTQKMPG